MSLSVRVEFQLTMPDRGSWDNKWSGDGHHHALVRDVAPEVARQLDGRTWSYAWTDGWRAEVRALILPEDETLRPSQGFRGYDWMVASILKYGKILAEHERPPAGGAA